MGKPRGLALVALVGLLLVPACGGSSESSRDRNVGVTLIGTDCSKAGKLTKKQGSSYVCATVKRKALIGGVPSKGAGMLYGVAAIKNWRCVKLGSTRYQNGILSVCSGGKSSKSRKWALTAPLPGSVATTLDGAASTAVGALEEVGVSIPAAIALPPDSGGGEIASGDGTGPIVGTTTTTTLPSVFVVKLAPDPGEAPAAEMTSTTVSEATTTLTEMTTTLAASPTASSSSTTVAPTATATVPPTTVPPTTVPPTTVAPTTVAPTTVPPTTVPPTTVAPTTVPPKTLTCAEGGVCRAGDRGPAGGVVVLSNFDLSRPGSLIEVAPVTWYFSTDIASRGAAIADGLVFGRKSDWRLPTFLDLLAIRRDRAQFRCPSQKRCALGFSRGVYLSANEGQGVNGLNFGGNDLVPTRITDGAYVRPVRTVGPVPGQSLVSIDLRPS